jgi:glutathione S-transferase
MKLYGALLSPFVRKVAIVLAEKGLAYEARRGGPGTTDPEFLAVSPFAKIPVLDDDGFILPDSTAIALYLDAQYPEPSLIPAAPQARGRAIWLDEFADTLLAEAAIKVQMSRIVGPRFLGRPVDEDMARAGEAELPRALDYLESVAPEAGWLLGTDFTLADISVGVALRAAEFVGCLGDAAARPRMAAWFERLKARPSWQSVADREAALIARALPDLANAQG